MEKKILLTILLIAFAFRLVGSLIFPIWAGPDEPSHFAYIQFLAKEGYVPALPIEVLDGGRNALYETVQQPPLFYAIAAPFFLLFEGLGTNFLVHAMRFLVVIAGTICVYSIYLLAKELTGKENFSLIAAAFIALLPTHIVVSAVINNGPLAWLLVSASALYMVKAIKNGFNFPDCIIAGLLLGLGVWTKITSLSLAVGFLFFFLLVFKKSKMAALKKAVVIALPLLIAVPYFARNIIVYGSLIPAQPEMISKLTLDWAIYFVVHFFPGIWLQEYGAAEIPGYRVIFFALFGLFFLVSLAGISLAVAAKRKQLSSFFGRKLLEKKHLDDFEKKISGAAVLLLGLLANFAGLVYLNMKWLFVDARLMFETIGFGAIFFVWGLQHFSGKTNRRLFYALVFLLFLSMIWLDIILIINANKVLPKVPWPVYC